MEVTELIKLDSRKVRGNSSLMAIYIDAFQNQFGRKPNCAGCTFGTDFANLTRAVQGGDKAIKTKNLKSNKMENTFKLKKIQSKILAYRKDGKTFRVYDSAMKEEFAVAFLTNGSEEELKERKAMFAVLPESMQGKAKAKPEPVVAATTEEETEATDIVQEETVVDETAEETVIVPAVKKTRKSRKNR